MHHGAEDHRGDHHLDELDEAVAKRLQRLAGVGEKMPDQGADGDRNQDLDVEDRIPGMPYGMTGTISNNFWAHFAMLTREPDRRKRAIVRNL